MLSDAFINRVRTDALTMETLAQKAGADRYWLSRLLSTSLAISGRDRRIVKLGQLVGLKPEEIFR